MVVVGHAARDLVLLVDEVPGAGASASVDRRVERLGGKGANIAVGLRQLEPRIAPVLLAVLGEDPAGEQALREARDAGIDVGYVARRGTTALLVDLVAGAGERRLLEDVTPESLLTPADVTAAERALRTADVVVLQLQQPDEALLAAARDAHAGGARIVLDGATEGAARGELLSLATVVRADAEEAVILTGTEIDGVDDAERAARELLAHGPALVALSVPDAGDLLVWDGGTQLYPHGDAPVVDPTGAGDAFVAGLVAGLARGWAWPQIGQAAADAAAATVQRLGGHPELRPLGDDGDGGASHGDRAGA
ncbi:MAG: PfkB family carbohydrate kinase [Agrococcus sp.]